MTPRTPAERRRRRAVVQKNGPLCLRSCRWRRMSLCRLFVTTALAAKLDASPLVAVVDSVGRRRVNLRRGGVSGVRVEEKQLSSCGDGGGWSFVRAEVLALN